MLDHIGLMMAEGVGEASRMTRVAITKAALDMAAAFERNGVQMTPAETLRFFASVVTDAWEKNHVS